MTTYLERRIVAQEAERKRKHDEMLARAIACQELKEQGYSLRAIGRALGISYETVRRSLYDVTR